MSHRVVFIIISQSAISTSCSRLRRINESYMIRCVSLESDCYWSDCQVKGFYFQGGLFERSALVFVRLIRWWRHRCPQEILRAATQDHQNSVKWCLGGRGTIIHLGTQTHLPLSNLLIFPKEVHVKPSTSAYMKHKAQYNNSIPQNHLTLSAGKVIANYWVSILSLPERLFAVQKQLQPSLKVTTKSGWHLLSH